MIRDRSTCCVCTCRVALEKLAAMRDIDEFAKRLHGMCDRHLGDLQEALDLRRRALRAPSSAETYA